MTTNGHITIYSKNLDKETGLNNWEYKHYIAMIQGGLGASLNKGYDEANDLKIFIPKIENKIKDVAKYEFSIGDIVVVGKIKENIQKEAELKKITQVYNIKTIIPQNYGSDELQHIEIGAK